MYSIIKGYFAPSSKFYFEPSFITKVILDTTLNKFLAIDLLHNFKNSSLGHLGFRFEVTWLLYLHCIILLEWKIPFYEFVSNPLNIMINLKC